MDFKRISHFEYVPIPGGDLATKETWRSALSYLYKTFGTGWNKTGIPFLKLINLSKANKLIEAIDKKINSPLCCSAGRLFDAVAVLTGICTESNYHAEAPLLLENYLDENFEASYHFTGDEIISFLPLINAMVIDIQSKKPVHQIVTQFHNTIAEVAFRQINFAIEKNPLKKVVLTGGTFQNKYLTEKLIHLLKKTELEIFLPKEVPYNDGGIALGQLAIAANKKNI
jgi:hydrogenase maturation protein HypF